MNHIHQTLKGLLEPLRLFHIWLLFLKPSCVRFTHRQHPWDESDCGGHGRSEMTNTSRGREAASHSTPGSTGAIFSEDRCLKPTPDVFAGASVSRPGCGATVNVLFCACGLSPSSMHILGLCNGISLCCSALFAGESGPSPSGRLTTDVDWRTCFTPLEADLLGTSEAT